MSLYSSRLVAAALQKQAKGKAEAGKVFPAGDYAYVPDKEKPSTWKLRLTEVPGGAPTPAQVGRAVAALGPGGFRGRKVQVPAAAMAAVKRRVAAAYRKANPGKKVPALLVKAAAEVDAATASAAQVAKDCCEPSRRPAPPVRLFTDVVDGHQHVVEVSLDPDRWDFYGGYVDSATSEGAPNSHNHQWRWGPNGTIEITVSEGHGHSVDLSAVLQRLAGTAR